MFFVGSSCHDPRSQRCGSELRLESPVAHGDQVIVAVEWCYPAKRVDVSFLDCQFRLALRKWLANAAANLWSVIQSS